MNQATHHTFAYHTGRMVGRYKLLELLGSGGTAEVYRSVHPDLARDVAIKILYPTFTNDPGFVKRFRQEAQTAAALVHPHIVQVYDFDVTDDGLYYIVMQYINGSSLETYLAENPGPLPLDLAYQYFRQVADALQFAHNQGAIHRDLKPANILLNGRDHLYLSDFGFAKLVGVAMHTRSSMTLGTPVYMAPEQIESGPVTLATDVYAMGAILYEMVAGRRPYESDNVLTLIMSKVEDPPRPPRQHNPAIPPALEKVILKAMDINPQARYATVAAMSAALAAIQGVDVPATVTETQTAPTLSAAMRGGTSRRKWLALLPVGLLLVCLLALVFRAQNPVMVNGLAPTSVSPSSMSPTQPAVIMEATTVPTTPAATLEPSATAVQQTTASATATLSPSPTHTATASPSPTRTPSATRTASPTATATRTPRPAATHTPTATAVPPTPEPPTPVPATEPPPPPTEAPPTEPPPTEPPPTPEPPTRTPPPPPTASS